MKESKYRALRTFIQSFVGYIAANVIALCSGVDIFSKEGAKYLVINLIIPAIATALAALMNYEKEMENEEGEEDDGNV